MVNAQFSLLSVLVTVHKTTVSVHAMPVMLTQLNSLHACRCNNLVQSRAFAAVYSSAFGIQSPSWRLNSSTRPEPPLRVSCFEETALLVSCV